MFHYVLFYPGNFSEISEPLLRMIEEYCKYPVQHVDVQFSSHVGTFVATSVNEESAVILPPDMTYFPCLVVYRGMTTRTTGPQRPYTYHLGNNIYQELGIPIPSEVGMTAASVPLSSVISPSSSSVPTRHPQQLQQQPHQSASDWVHGNQRQTSNKRLSPEELEKQMRAFQEERENLVPSGRAYEELGYPGGGGGGGAGGYEGRGGAGGGRNNNHSSAAGGGVSHRPAPPVIAKGFGL